MWFKHAWWAAHWKNTVYIEFFLYCGLFKGTAHHQIKNTYWHIFPLTCNFVHLDYFGVSCQVLDICYSSMSRRTLPCDMFGGSSSAYNVHIWISTFFKSVKTNTKQNFLISIASLQSNFTLLFCYSNTDPKQVSQTNIHFVCSPNVQW